MFDIESSGTVKIFNLAKRLEENGQKLIHLEVGEPDIDTPDYITNATIEAIKNKWTKYTQTRGLLGLRKEIQKYIIDRYSAEGISAENNIIVTPGAKFGLFSSLLSFANSGDEILVFSPSYPSYRSIPHAMNIKVKEVPILKGPKIIPMDDIIEDVQKKVSDKTRFFILNGPCNPTGQVIYHDTLKRLWEVLEPYENIIFLADDIYEQLIYPPATFESTVQFDPKLERTIIINGFSKSFSMTGYRLGYIVSNQKFIERLSRFQQNSVTCATTFSQKAGEIALKSYNEKWPEYLSFRESFINELNKRRKLIYNQLKSIKNLGVNEPEGAFYIFPDISHYEMDSHKFVMDLIKEKNIVTTPGNVFGKNGEGHIRISFTRPINELKEAIDKIKEFLEDFKS